MTWTAITLPLYSDPTYTYTASLEGTTFRFSFAWSDRTTSWHMSLYTEESETIVEGIRLVGQYPLLADLQLSAFGMTGYFLVMPINALTIETSPALITDLSDRYSLIYLYEEA